MPLSLVMRYHFRVDRVTAASGLNILFLLLSLTRNVSERPYADV